MRPFAQLKDAGANTIFVKTDVSKWHDVDTMIARTVENYGQLDSAFNNAGIEGEVARPTNVVKPTGIT